MHTDFFSLYRATLLSAQTARETARHGNRDSARATLNFIRYGRILEILKPYNGQGLVPIDVPHLEWTLRELENDCHPSTQHDFKDDFSAIRVLLEVIAGGVNTLIQDRKQKAVKRKL